MIQKITPETKRTIKASDKFVFILALISIAGFISIISRTLFNYNLDYYITSIWFLIVGIGFLIEGQPTKLKNIRQEGLTPSNFTRITTIIIGFMSILAGILGSPQINITSAGFLAVEGIIAIIAIIIIIVQTWVVKS
ncbi:hypothetical protein COU60_05185 [Candidatus Pacearchaeota archaeon CG10_big_fil_rev_8_21_14_0_10_34_76]|nr:MAG: hypothetical protein COU60_05185 [Candidatus Pacearchaeota archaeon CG10_big_fil_rev_8_21_14_0_10_34_76]